MIDFNEPLLEDKSAADQILHDLCYRADDFSFGNLFIWKHYFNYKIALRDGLLLVRYTSGQKPLYLFPVGKGDKSKALKEMAEDAEKHNHAFELGSVTPAIREEIENIYPGKFEYTEDRANFDYIYASEDLIELKGRKYHSKRNHVTRFKTLGDWSYEEINASNMAECVEMNDLWCRENGGANDNNLKAEHLAVELAMDNCEALGFSGGLLRLDGKIVAFSMGEMLCRDTFVIHIEKAFSDVEGAYAAINSEFAAHNCVNYQYVNREEDTGNEGLRKAKLSYHPAILLEKYYAVLKPGESL